VSDPRARQLAQIRAALDALRESRVGLMGMQSGQECVVLGVDEFDALIDAVYPPDSAEFAR